jgi:phage shock protein A
MTTRMIAFTAAMLLAAGPAWAESGGSGNKPDNDGSVIKDGQAIHDSYVDIKAGAITKDELAKPLADQIDKNTNDIKALDHEVDAQGDKIKKLDHEVDEQGDKIKKIDHEVYEQGGKIKKLDHEVDEQGGKIKKLDKEVDHQGHEIHGLQESDHKQWHEIHEIKEVNSRQDMILEDHSEHLSALDSQVSALRGQMYNLNNRVDKAYSGIAMAMAMESPQVDPGHKFGVALNWGTFEGYNAGAFNGKFRFDNNISITGGVSVAEKGTVGGRAGLQFQW